MSKKCQVPVQISDKDEVLEVCGGRANVKCEYASCPKHCVVIQEHLNYKCPVLAHSSASLFASKVTARLPFVKQYVSTFKPQKPKPEDVDKKIHDLMEEDTNDPGDNPNGNSVVTPPPSSPPSADDIKKIYSLLEKLTMEHPKPALNPVPPEPSKSPSKAKHKSKSKAKSDTESSDSSSSESSSESSESSSSSSSSDSSSSSSEDDKKKKKRKKKKASKHKKRDPTDPWTKKNAKAMIEFIKSEDLQGTTVGPLVHALKSYAKVYKSLRKAGSEGTETLLQLQRAAEDILHNRHYGLKKTRALYEVSFFSAYSKALKHAGTPLEMILGARSNPKTVVPPSNPEGTPTYAKQHVQSGPRKQQNTKSAKRCFNCNAANWTPAHVCPHKQNKA